MIDRYEQKVDKLAGRTISTILANMAGSDFGEKMAGRMILWTTKISVCPSRLAIHTHKSEVDGSDERCTMKPAAAGTLGICSTAC